MNQIEYIFYDFFLWLHAVSHLIKNVTLIRKSCGERDFQTAFEVMFISSIPLRADLFAWNFVNFYLFFIVAKIFNLYIRNGVLIFLGIFGLISILICF